MEDLPTKSVVLSSKITKRTSKDLHHSTYNKLTTGVRDDGVDSKLTTQDRLSESPAKANPNPGADNCGDSVISQINIRLMCLPVYTAVSAN